jgi:hypothetical protein
MLICFFDLATNSGWAAGDGDCEPESGVIHLPKTGDDLGSFMVNADYQFGLALDNIRPSLIGYESPIFMNPRKTKIAILRKLYSLASKLEELAVRRGIKICEAQNGEIRRHFLGAGYPVNSDRAKQLVYDRCRTMGWAPENFDASDALAGLDYLLALHRPSHALKITPMFADKL